MNVREFEDVIIRVCGTAVLDSIKSQLRESNHRFYKQRIQLYDDVGYLLDVLLTWTNTREGVNYWHHLSKNVFHSMNPKQIREQLDRNPFNRQVGGV